MILSMLWETTDVDINNRKKDRRLTKYIVNAAMISFICYHIYYKCITHISLKSYSRAIDFLFDFFEGGLLY